MNSLTEEFLLEVLGLNPVTFQTFPDNDTCQNSPMIVSGTISQHAKRLQSLNERGNGIFFMVNQGDGQGRRTVNVTGVTSYFADLDGTPVLKPKDYPLCPTSIIKTSPDRYHLYWKIKDARPQSFSHVQEHLAILLGSDPKIKDLPRVMRLPGFYHQKREAFLVDVIFLSGRAVYTYEQFLDRFALPAYKPIPPLPAKAKSFLEPTQSYRTKQLVRVASASSGARNQTLFSMAAAIGNDVKAGKVDRETATEELTYAGQQAGLAENEIRKTIRSAFNYAKDHQQ